MKFDYAKAQEATFKDWVEDGCKIAAKMIEEAQKSELLKKEKDASEEN